MDQTLPKVVYKADAGNIFGQTGTNWRLSAERLIYKNPFASLIQSGLIWA